MKENLLPKKNLCVDLNAFCKTLLLLLLSVCVQQVKGQQEEAVYSLRLTLPVVDLPQNASSPNQNLSMNQALLWSNSVYDLGFWGIGEMGNSLFKNSKKPLVKNAFTYVAGLAFSKYGSELPIPLGVWAHEEFHRSVLGTNGIASSNGNWILNRWDGTVYGVSDEALSHLKSERPEALLYAYVAGVQSEVLSTEYNTIQDVHHKRQFYKNALYLYHAYYVWNYFNFSTSAASDSSKILVPQHESPLPSERDFAGSDLTAWVYDMFNPGQPFTDREDFPKGEGVNRRIGFSDLSPEAQDFLKKQQNLSLLNFINPAIFFINRIKVSPDFSFNAFMQYVPTHFGNDIALVVPISLNAKPYRLKVHNFNNRSNSFWGLDVGRSAIPIAKNLSAKVQAYTWVQPAKQDFFATKGKMGGALELGAEYRLGRSFTGYAAFTGKTEGWLMGSPYTGKKLMGTMGIHYNWSKN